MMSVVLKFTSLLVVFLVSGGVYAQCGAGIPSGGNPNCIPPDAYHSQGITQPQMTAPVQRPIIIRHKWEDRWGAMVLDDVNPVTGFASGARSKNEAMQLAKQDCFSKGGGGCGDVYAYRSQCAVMVAIKGGGARYVSAATVEEAENIGMRSCAEKKKVCRVIYSNCSLPEAVPIH